MASEELILRKGEVSQARSSSGSDKRSLTSSLVDKFENASKSATSLTDLSSLNKMKKAANLSSTNTNSVSGKIISPRKKTLARKKEEESSRESKNPFKNLLKKTTKSNQIKSDATRSTSSTSLKNSVSSIPPKSSINSKINSNVASNKNSNSSSINNSKSNSRVSLQSLSNKKTPAELNLPKPRLSSQSLSISKSRTPSDSQDEKHKETLVSCAKAKILEYGGTADRITTNPGSLLGYGTLELYKLQKDSSVMYIQCGSVIYSLLAKSKVLKVGHNAFVLPLSNPERYWKISLNTKDSNLINEFASHFQANCEYLSLFFDHQEEDNNDAEKTDLTAIQSNSVAQDTIRTQANYVDADEEPELVPYQQLLKEAEMRRLKSLEDSSSVIRKPMNENEIDPFTSELSFIARKQQSPPLLKMTSKTNLQKSASDTSITSTVACFSLNDDSPNADNDKIIYPKRSQDAASSDANDDTRVETNTEKGNETSPLLNQSSDLLHPRPLRPNSIGSSLDSVLDKFDIPSPNSPLTHEGTLSTIAAGGLQSLSNSNNVYNMNFTTVQNSPQITSDSLFLNEEDSWMDPDEKNDRVMDSEADNKSQIVDQSKDDESIASVMSNGNYLNPNIITRLSSNSSNANMNMPMNVAKQRLHSQDSKSRGITLRTRNKSGQRVSSFDISRRYSLTFKDFSVSNTNLGLEGDGTAMLSTYATTDLKELLIQTRPGKSRGQSQGRSYSENKSSSVLSTGSEGRYSLGSSSGGTSNSSTNDIITHSKYTLQGSKGGLHSVAENPDFNLNCFEETNGDESNKDQSAEKPQEKVTKSNYIISNILGW